MVAHISTLKGCLIKLSIFVLVVGFLLYGSFQALFSYGFSGLPNGATNGTWTRRAIDESHPSLFDSVYDLVYHTPNIVRVRVVSERTANKRTSGNPNGVDSSASVYRLYILEVYKGMHQSGEYIEAQQARHIHYANRSYWRQPGLFRLPRGDYSVGLQYINYIRVEVDIGDELILFLGDPVFVEMVGRYRVPRLLTIQGMYFNDLKDCGITFVPVNPLNNLTLNIEDLTSIPIGEQD